jgi:hypothetical protein
VLGRVERRLALPIFEGVFRGIFAARQGWSDGLRLLQGEVGKLRRWAANGTQSSQEEGGKLGRRKDR